MESVPPPRLVEESATKTDVPFANGNRKPDWSTDSIWHALPTPLAQLNKRAHVSHGSCNEKFIPFRVLYLYAGAEREADILGAVRQYINSINLLMVQAGISHQISLSWSALDLLRKGPMNDLTVPLTQEKLVEGMNNFDWDLLLASPPAIPSPG